ncbi:hypothetical protein LG293_16795 (plasmid) [Citricoccus nitrophenolicus]
MSSTAVLADLEWETLANNLEAWLETGRQAPMPDSLDVRPTGTPPAHLYARLVDLTGRLGEALNAMTTTRDGLDASRRAAWRVAAATTAPRSSTFVDIGA